MKIDEMTHNLACNLSHISCPPDGHRKCDEDITKYNCSLCWKEYLTKCIYGELNEEAKD